MADRLIAAPKDNLVRQVPFTLERAVAAPDGQTLTGHGAVFNQWTEIDSWEGTFQERIAPGAFKKTLRESGSKVRLQFDHGQHPLIGSIPIGSILDLREDDVGLFVQARLLDNWLIEPVRDAIREGAIDGMSFRFSVEKESWAEVDGVVQRTISEVRLMEVGPVVWPAYAGTDVGVRSLQLARDLAAADDQTRREVARVLTATIPSPATRMGSTSSMTRAQYYSDLRLQLDAELSELFPEQDGAWLWVRDFNDSEVIFDLEGYGDDDGTYRLAYSVDEEGQVVLAATEPELVIVQTTYVPEPAEPAGRSDTPTQGAAREGTPGQGAVDTEEPPVGAAPAGTPDAEHSSTPHIPAARGAMPLERVKRDLAEVEGFLAAATP